MKKSICLGLISLLAAGTAVAQLPANPWDTAEFDAAVAAHGGNQRMDGTAVLQIAA